MRRTVPLFMLLVALVGVASLRAHSAAPVSVSSDRLTFVGDRFYRDLRQLVRRYYPDATTHHLKDKIHFEHDTRVFLIHSEERGGGEWRDPVAERGPKKNGIYCDIEYRDGTYPGMAVVPHEFDTHYFTLLLMAPESDKLDSHLYVHLKHPKSGRNTRDFVEEVTKFLNGFEQYADTIVD